MSDQPHRFGLVVIAVSDADLAHRVSTAVRTTAARPVEVRPADLVWFMSECNRARTDVPAAIIDRALPADTLDNVRNIAPSTTIISAAQLPSDDDQHRRLIQVSDRLTHDQWLEELARVGIR